MRVALSALIVLITACGRAAAPVAEAPASPTPSAIIASPTPAVASPTAATSSSTTTFGVIVDLRTGPGYTVALVGADGHVAAKAQAALRSLSPGAGIADLPYVSISSSRVYYLDGDSVVRWLDPTGGVGTGPTLPGTKTAAVVFAVTPDDTQIAVSRFDFSASPAFVQLYTDSVGGGNQRYIFKSWTDDYIWPVGWHAGNIVLAAQTFAPLMKSGTAWNPYGALTYHVVNPVTADRLFTLGNGEDQQKGCQPTGPLTAAGTACSQYGATSGSWGTLGIVDWTGQFHVVGGPLHTPSSVEVSSASSDASSSQLVFCCDTFRNFLVVGPNGYVNTQLGGGLNPVGTDWACWLDGTHLLSGSIGGGMVQDAQGNSVSSSLVSTYAFGHKAATPVTASGFCAGVLPASLG